MKIGLIISTFLIVSSLVLSTFATTERGTRQLDQALATTAKKHIPKDYEIVSQSIWPNSAGNKSRRAVVAAGPYLYLFTRAASGNWKAAGKHRVVKQSPGSNPTPQWVEFANDGTGGFVYSANEIGFQFSGFTCTKDGIKGEIPELSEQVLKDLKRRVGKRLQQEKPAPLNSFPNAKGDLDKFLDAAFKYLNVGLRANFK